MQIHGNRSSRKKKSRQRKLLAFGCLILALVLGILIWILLQPTPKQEDAVEPIKAQESVPFFPLFTPKPRIPDGITISDISVGGMMEQEAIEILQEVYTNKVEEQDLVITYGDSQLTLSPVDTQVHWDYQTAVNTAMKGQSSDLKITYNKEVVRSKVKTFFKSLGGVYSPASFWLEGKMPDLSIPGDECQTLILTTGSEGLPIFLEDVYEQIQNTYQAGLFEIILEDAGEIKQPQPLDLESVSSQVCIAPINPDIDRKTLEIIPGKPGYSFDSKDAAALLDTALPGESVRISMKYVEPTLTEADVWFQDSLGFCKTPYKENENRTENLRLACKKLNGLILQPGDTFSYNQTLGKRTTAAGYKPAPAYSGTVLVDEVGGGICQVSSTLYLSALFAELSIVDRKNHGYPADYIPMGLDATVNWGTTDLKIRNDYDLPVKIRAEVTNDGYVKVWILGVEQRNYNVKMEYRVDDHPSYAAAFRCRYDKETGKEIYRKLDHTSTYLEDVWCWPGYAENIPDEIS